MTDSKFYGLLSSLATKVSCVFREKNTDVQSALDELDTVIDIPLNISIKTTSETPQFYMRKCGRLFFINMAFKINETIVYNQEIATYDPSSLNLNHNVNFAAKGLLNDGDSCLIQVRPEGHICYLGPTVNANSWLVGYLAALID